MKHALAGFAAVLCLFPGSVLADDDALTLDQALAQARLAPRAVEAMSRVDEARGRMVDASALLHENPVLQGSRGRRTTDVGGEFVDSDLELSQTFELGGRRKARMAGAGAEIAAAEATAAETIRELQRDTAIAFLRALHAQERARLAQETVQIAQDTMAAAERRLRAGDVAILDVNISRVALARARSEVLAAQADIQAALRDLRVHLGFGRERPLTVSGDLRVRQEVVLEQLLIRAAERPDIHRIEALIRQTQADNHFARSLSWPGLGVGVRQAREEGDRLLLGTLSFSLPIFQRGKGLRIESEARERRLQVELAALRRAVEVEVKSAAAVAQLRADTVAQLETEAVPLASENEALARRGYEAGQIGLTDLLALRRETLETRMRYLEALLDAALAAFDLRAAAGMLP